jgi:hypothetical protein
MMRRCRGTSSSRLRRSTGSLRRWAAPPGRRAAPAAALGRGCRRVQPRRGSRSSPHRSQRPRFRWAPFSQCGADGLHVGGRRLRSPRRARAGACRQALRHPGALPQALETRALPFRSAARLRRAWPRLAAATRPRSHSARASIAGSSMAQEHGLGLVQGRPRRHGCRPARGGTGPGCRPPCRPAARSRSPRSAAGLLAGPASASCQRPTPCSIALRLHSTWATFAAHALPGVSSRISSPMARPRSIWSRASAKQELHRQALRAQGRVQPRVDAAVGGDAGGLESGGGMPVGAVEVTAAIQAPGHLAVGDAHRFAGTGPLGQRQHTLRQVQRALVVAAPRMQQCQIAQRGSDA